LLGLFVEVHEKFADSMTLGQRAGGDQLVKV
jgi:hypothetical protein